MVDARVGQAARCVDHRRAGHQIAEPSPCGPEPVISSTYLSLHQRSASIRYERILVGVEIAQVGLNAGHQAVIELPIKSNLPTAGDAAQRLRGYRSAVEKLATEKGIAFAPGISYMSANVEPGPVRCGNQGS